MPNLPPRFRDLDFFDDSEPHSAAFNMAADEVLLARAQRPLLRVYGWDRPSVSFGYFQPLKQARMGAPASYPAVRRATGGGLVVHGGDLTYSLVVPCGFAEARMSPAESYRFLHVLVRDALRSAGYDRAHLADAVDANVRPAGECFRRPVPWDVMIEGGKVAGAAQKRTRRGLLHQGSIQNLDLPDNFGEMLACILAGTVQRTGDALMKWKGEIESLAAEKYGAPAWNERVP